MTAEPKIDTGQEIIIKNDSKPDWHAPILLRLEIKRTFLGLISSPTGKLSDSQDYLLSN